MIIPIHTTLELAVLIQRVHEIFDFQLAQLKEHVRKHGHDLLNDDYCRLVDHYYKARKKLQELVAEAQQ